MNDFLNRIRFRDVYGNLYGYLNLFFYRVRFVYFNLVRNLYFFHYGIGLWYFDFYWIRLIYVNLE